MYRQRTHTPKHFHGRVRLIAPTKHARNVTAKLFTGIVQGKATVSKVENGTEITRFQVAFPEGKADGVSIGASVALNGTCLTVTSIDSDQLSFDVIAETLRRTNLGRLSAGSTVNFERSARVGDEIGGHTVSGHVQSTATVEVVEKRGDDVRLQFRLDDPSWIKYVMPKGFIAVDGCSLTVGEVVGDCFSVYLIPETLRVTVLGEAQEGSSVNIEIESQTQAIVDTVERVIAARLGALDAAVA